MKRTICPLLLLVLLAAAPLGAAQLMLVQSGFSDGSVRSSSASFALEQTSGFDFGGQATSAGYLEAGGFYPFGTVVSGVAIGDQDAGASLPALPRTLSLQPAFPNPGREATIRYGLPGAADVSLIVYNITGSRVATLASGRQPAGWHAAQFSGKDQYGRSLASGVYLYRLRAGQRCLTGRMILLR